MVGSTGTAYDGAAYAVQRERRGSRFFALLRSAQNDRIVKQYYVYMMTNRRRTLYAGVTSNLERRVGEHKRRLRRGFTSSYNIRSLVYYEAWADIRAAIAREKQIKGWRRAKKVALIELVNPTWRDLSEGWFE